MSNCGSPLPRRVTGWGRRRRCRGDFARVAAHHPANPQRCPNRAPRGRAGPLGAGGAGGLRVLPPRGRSRTGAGDAACSGPHPPARASCPGPETKEGGRGFRFGKRHPSPFVGPSGVSHSGKNVTETCFRGWGIFRPPCGSGAGRSSRGMGEPNGILPPGAPQAVLQKLPRV